MKKFFISLIALAFVLSNSVYAQDTIFKEGFNESTLPSGWEYVVVYDNNMSTTPSVLCITKSINPSGLFPTEGARIVKFNSYNCEAGDKLRLYQTTPFSTTGKENISVNFDWLHSNLGTSSPDSVYVQWSINGTDWNTAEGVGRIDDAVKWLSKTIVLPVGANNQSSLYVAFLFVSKNGYNCHLDNLVVKYGASSPEPSVTILPKTQSVTAIAGTTNFGVTSNTAWTATSDQAWCTVTPSGTNDGTLSTTYEANTGTTERTATIIVKTNSGIKSDTATLVQAVSTGISISITPSIQNVSMLAGTFNFTVTSNAAWTATSDHEEWCAVTPPSGTGNNTLVATYMANNGTTERTATITVTAGSEIATAKLTQIASTTKTLSVTPNAKDTTKDAGFFNIYVTSNTEWTVASNQTWLTLETIGGSNNDVVKATYEANTDNNQRIGEITFKAIGLEDVVVYFTQHGVEETTIAIAPSIQNVTAIASTATFNVTSNAAWTVASNQTWCTVTPSGIGNGSITTTYETNTGAMRTATITATTADGKVATATLTQEEFVGIEDVNAQIFVYPNPSEDVFNIVLDGNSYNIVVVDILGNVVHKNTFNNNYKLNMSNNAAGTYFVKIVSAEKTLTQKIVLK